MSPTQKLKKESDKDSILHRQLERLAGELFSGVCAEFIYLICKKDLSHLLGDVS